MLEIAKERAASLGLQEIIEFKERDTEILDLPNSYFDAVHCRWDSAEPNCRRNK